MLFYIDGDNSPGTRTVGIDILRKTDTVKVFYANSNKYYSSKTNRDKLVEAAVCNVSFHNVIPAANSVDFAVAVDCAKELALNDNQVICLISQDKHFQIIRELVKEHYESVIVCVNSLKDGFAMLNILEFDKLSELERNMCVLYGAAVGQRTFKKIKAAFDEAIENESIKKKHNKLYSLRQHIVAYGKGRLRQYGKYRKE